ncbi:12629_t:CDS:1, partial [Dentiscutata erythropus]
MTTPNKISHRQLEKSFFKQNQQLYLLVLKNNDDIQKMKNDINDIKKLLDKKTDDLSPQILDI